MGNSRGTGPATPGSPAYLATQVTDEPQKQTTAAGWSRFDKAVRQEVTMHFVRPLEIPSMDEDEESSVDIDATFQRKVAGLRYLPPRARAAAYRAARDERDLALRGLRERRAARSHFRKLLLQHAAPTPFG